MLVVILAFTPFIQGGCGGGGGGGSGVVGEGTGPVEPVRTLATLDASNAESSPEAVNIENVEFAVDLGFAVLDESTFAFALSVDTGQTSIFQKVEGILDRVKSEARTGTVHASGVEPPLPPDPKPCSGGGSVDLSMDWDGPDGFIEFLQCDQVSNLHVTITMNNCMELGIEMDGTMDITVPGSFCDDFPTDMNMSFNFTVNDEDFNVDFEDISMDLTNIVWDESSEEILGMDIITNGTVSGSEEGLSFSESYDDFIIGYTENGSEVIITMDGFVQTSCISGWIEVSTQEPLIFSYIDGLDSCPVGGLVTLSGEGEIIISINFNTSIDISLNGDDIQSYRTCENVPSCLG